MSNRQPLPSLMTRPHFVCTVSGTRLLAWGVFETRAAAESKADFMCRGAVGFLRREIKVERIHVSRRQR